MSLFPDDLVEEVRAVPAPARGDPGSVGLGWSMEARVDVPDGVRALLQADLDDLEGRLERAHRRYRRHLLWLLLGASPGALLPLLFVVSEVGGGALVVGILCVMVAEGWRALRTKRLIRRLETQAMDVRDRWRATEPAGRSGSGHEHTGSVS